MARAWLSRRHNPADALAEADADRAVAFAQGLERDLVAVLEEAAGFAVWKRDRLLAALTDLQQ